MSTMTFGRVGLTTVYGGSDYSMRAPSQFDAQGRTVSLSGVQLPATFDDDGWWDLIAWREAMLGHDPASGGDEPVIPVTVPDVAFFDGFYRVLGVSVGLPPGSLGTSSELGYMAVPWSASLERVAHSTIASQESLSVYGLRTNSHSITSADYMVAIPSTAVTWSFPRSGTRSVGDTGKSVAINIVSAGTSGTISHRYQVDPYHHYVGSGRIEWQPGTSWRAVTGRRSFTDVDKVRLSNGLVRVNTVSVSGGKALSVEWWDGTQWDSAVQFEPRQTTNSLGSDNPLESVQAASIVSNRPEEVTVRYVVEFGGLMGERCTMDVSLRRGSRWVEIFVQAGSSVQWRLQTHSTFNAASTSITGGVRRTSDLNGSRWILAGPTATVKDTTNGAVDTTAAATSVSFGIGCEVGGSGASGQDTAANQIDEFYRPVSETVRVQDF